MDRLRHLLMTVHQSTVNFIRGKIPRVSMWYSQFWADTPNSSRHPVNGRQSSTHLTQSHGTKLTLKIHQVVLWTSSSSPFHLSTLFLPSLTSILFFLSRSHTSSGVFTGLERSGVTRTSQPLIPTSTESMINNSG